MLDPGQEAVAVTLRRVDPPVRPVVPSTAVLSGTDGALCVWTPEGGGYRARQVAAVTATAGVTELGEGLEPGVSVLANPAEILEQPACPAS